MAQETIDEVINELGEIIEWSKGNKSRLGYFPALYQKVTKRIKMGIAAGEFEDGSRMEKLDVVFAKRYIDAHKAWQAGLHCTDSWRVASEAAGRWRYIVIQHLFVGMNAHINLDLAIAAAEISSGQNIHDLEVDFKRITRILNDLTDSVKQDLADVWPLLRILDWFSGRIGDWLANLGMTIARDIAWDNAVKLSMLDEDHLQRQISAMDGEVARLSNIILSPSILANILIRFIRLGEMRRVEKIIDILSD